MAPTFLGGQWSPCLPSLALTPPFPAQPDDVWLETPAWAGAVMLGKFCQPGMPWDQVLEVLFVLYKGVRKGMELPKGHEHTCPHPHGHGCGLCMCHGHSWSGCLFADPCSMQSRIAQKYSAWGLNPAGLEMSPSP